MRCSPCNRGTVWVQACVRDSLCPCPLVQCRVTAGACGKELATCKKDPSCAKLHLMVEMTLQAEHGGKHHSGDKRQHQIGVKRQLQSGDKKPATHTAVKAAKEQCNNHAACKAVLKCKGEHHKSEGAKGSGRDSGFSKGSGSGSRKGRVAKRRLEHHESKDAKGSGRDRAFSKVSGSGSGKGSGAKRQVHGARVAAAVAACAKNTLCKELMQCEMREGSGKGRSMCWRTVYGCLIAPWWVVYEAVALRWFMCMM